MTDINDNTKPKSGTKEYHAIKSKEWYAKQSDEFKKERNKYRSVIRNRNKQTAIDYLGGKCNDCGAWSMPFKAGHAMGEQYSKSMPVDINLGKIKSILDKKKVK